jgi:amino-acid N-acetyltransferase
MGAIVRPATESDVAQIVATLAANASDRALFLRAAPDVRRHLEDFFVAEDTEHRLVGCGAVHRHTPRCAEILSVAVPPLAQARGIGSQLMREALKRGASLPAGQLWLATAKPGYFARFGFVPISRYALPTRVLVAKLRQVFDQPTGRWVPALFGRFTFMQHRAEREAAQPAPAAAGVFSR